MSDLHDSMGDKEGPPVYRTDAHALAAILGTVNEIDQPTLQQRWGQALGTRPKTQDMGQRHAEVVNLLTGTIDQIAALPEDRRDTYEQYFHPWWQAVVCPQIDWSAQTKGTKIITREHLSLLSSVGDVIEARMEHTSSAPGAFNLDQVAEQCTDWLGALQEPGALPDSLRRSLIQALTHVNWLVENVALFGFARVAKAANVVAGEALQAIPLVRPEARRTWAVRLAKWTALLAAYSAFAAGTAVAIERTEHLIEVATIAAMHVVDAIEGDGDAPSPNPAELEQKQGS